MRWNRVTPSLCLLFTIAGTASGDAHPRSLPVGTAAPPLQVADWLNVSSKGSTGPDLKSRAVLVEFFEPGCVPCKRSLPHIQSLHQRYAGRGLTIVCVSTETPAVLTAFAREWGYTMPIACDTAKSVFKAYQIKQWPTSVVVDKEGNIAYVGTPAWVDAPIETALGLQLEPGEILSTYAEASWKKDTAAVRTAIDRLTERATAEFDLKAWVASLPPSEAGPEVPVEGAPAPIPTDAAKALTEMLSAATPSSRREAIRLALAESAPTTFDLLAFARATIGREFPLTAKEAKEWVAAGRLDDLVEAYLDRQPPPVALEDAVKAKKAIAPRAARKAADARADARKALIVHEILFARELTEAQAQAAPFWADSAVSDWSKQRDGKLSACDVSGNILRPTTVSAFTDRRLAQALIFEALAAGKKPAFATLTADVAKARAAVVAELKSKYPK